MLVRPCAWEARLRRCGAQRRSRRPARFWPGEQLGVVMGRYGGSSLALRGWRGAACRIAREARERIPVFARFASRVLWLCCCCVHVWGRAERRRGEGAGLASCRGVDAAVRCPRMVATARIACAIACACVACLADELARMHAWVASLCLCSLPCVLMLVLSLLACCVCSSVASLYVVFVWCSKLEN